MDNFETLPIHRNKHFMKPCCAVINSEWPRSETARYQCFVFLRLWMKRENIEI